MSVKQDEEELAAFRRFVEMCPISIDKDAIAKRQPPEPDILCRFAQSGESVAFELLQIIDQLGPG